MHKLGCNCGSFCLAKVAASKESDPGRKILVYLGLMKPQDA